MSEPKREMRLTVTATAPDQRQVNNLRRAANRFEKATDARVVVQFGTTAAPVPNHYAKDIN